MENEVKAVDLNSVVAKSNEFIGQMAKYQLSELRLIAYCLSHYDSRKSDNRTVLASVSDLQKIFSMTTKDAYGVIKQAVRAVNRKPLEIETEKTEEEWFIFSGFKYYKDEGRFEFRLTPEAQPYLLQLRGNFTRYRLADVYQFKAASTWKMYELLKRWLVKREWTVGLAELRQLLGVAGKYPRWSDFENRMIKPTTKEINELSDLKVSYEKIKRGRPVVSVAFLIESKTPENADAIDIKTPEQELYWELKKAGINEKTAKSYATIIEKTGKTELVLKKLPGIRTRAAGKKGQEQRYILGAIQSELDQRELFKNPVEESKKRLAAAKWIQSLSDESLKSLASCGNIIAENELKHRKKSDITLKS